MIQFTSRSICHRLSSLKPQNCTTLYNYMDLLNISYVLVFCIGLLALIPVMHRVQSTQDAKIIALAMLITSFIYLEISDTFDLLNVMVFLHFT